MRVFLASTLRNDATSVVRGLLIAAGNAVPLRTGTGSNLPRCDVVVALVSVQPDADRLLQVWEEAKAAQAHRVPVVGASLAAPDELPAAVAAIPHDGQWIMVDVERQDAASLIEALAAVSHAQDRARQGRVAGAPPVHKQFPEIEATTGEDGFRRGPGEDRDRRSNSTAPRSTRLSYDAFMSYSHAVDGHLAPALQAGLQSLATPWYRRRALRVFRDKTSLSASPELWPAIEQALGNSAFFILLASPEAASSRWVNEEIGWWREHRTPETLLVALTSGRLTWDGADGDFGPEAAVPSSARGWLRSEPLWVDLRWAGSDEDLSARNPRFLDAVADLAAPLRGMPKDALVGEDLRQHRRTVRLARGVAVMLVLLIVASVAAAVIAIGQRNNAIAQSKSARSRELAAKAEAQRSVDPRVSLLLAIKAVETAETQEADAALRASLVSDQVGATLTGHRGTVIDADFESSGSRVVSAGEDGTVRVWSWASGRTDSVLRGHRGRVHAVDFGPSGREIASGGVDGTVRVWFERRPGESRDELVLRGHRGAVADVAFSPDGGRLASTGADGTIRVWDWRRRRLERVLRGHRPGRLQVGFGSRRTVSSVSFSPDGRSIVTGGADNTARVWDTRTGATLAVLRSGPNEPIQVTAEFHPDGRRIISNHRDGVRIWDWRRRTSRRVGIIAGGATDLHVSADGRTFVQGSPDGTVRTFDVSTGRETRALRGHSNAVLAVEFSRDGRRIVSAGADGMVRVWNENAPVALRATRRGAVTDISFDEDGRRLATTGQDGSLRLWDWRRARMVRGVRVPGGEALSVAWDSSGRRVATGSEDGSIALWDATTARLTARWRASKGFILSVAFSPDGRRLAAVGQGTAIAVWSLDGTPRAEVRYARAVRGVSRQILFGTDVVFTPDGRYLLTSWSDGVGRIWPAKGGRQRALLGHRGQVNSVRYSRDGAWAVTPSNDGTVRVWPGGRTRSHTVLRGHTGGVHAADFIGSGIVASGGSDGVRFWDWRQGRPVGALSGGTWVRHLAVTPDGLRLATAGLTRSVTIWDCVGCGPLTRVLATARERVSSTSLTRDQRRAYAEALGEGRP